MDMIWYKEQNDNDIVVSTRVRLARNLSKYPFPNAMDSETLKNAREEIENSVMNSNSTLSKDFTAYHMDETDDVIKLMLAEKHLISPDLLKKKEASVLINKDESMSVMLMEEDHIRMQVIMGGFKLDEAYELADKVDDVLDENVGYAFDADFGYLTSCPTNTGTGLRASVMMHLPALTMTKSIQRIASSASNLGIAVRGMYGEGSKAHGSLYQISNQVTLGLSEKEIIEKVKNIVNQIAEHEKQARKRIIDNNKDYIEDKIWRSYGTLKYARSISSKEAIELISDVLMGKNMGIIETGNNFIELMIMAEPAYIEHMEQKRLSPEERDKKRAELIRKNL
jgi:protein arginine kinase